MNLYETTYDGQSFFSGDGKAGSQRGLTRPNSLAWIALLSLLVLLALPTAMFAQRRSSGERIPLPQGVQAEVQTSAPIVLGPSGETVRIPGKLQAGDRGSGNFALDVVQSNIGGGVMAYNLYIRTLTKQAPSPAHLCWKSAPDGVQGFLVTHCTSSQSSLRYKTDLQPFLRGLNVVTRLEPRNFAWKESGMREIGLTAEDVAEVEPLLTFKNHKDEIEGVKYENLSVIFINAFKEQQAQIEELRQQTKALQEQLKQHAL